MGKCFDRKESHLVLTELPSALAGGWSAPRLIFARKPLARSFTPGRCLRTLNQAPFRDKIFANEGRCGC